MIKSYIELNEDEIKGVEKYLKNKSITNIKEHYGGKVYNHGEGVLFYINNNNVLGSVRVVLEAIKHLNVIYIHFLDVDNNVNNKFEIVKELLKAAINMSENKGVSKILFGVRDKEILEIVEKLGYTPSYNTYKMILEDSKIIGETLDIINLTEENKMEYLNIFNKSFSDMPHGSYYEIEDVEESLRDNSSNSYWLVSDNNKSIGVMNIDIENNIGSFDIGICNEYRGLGYGKKILETAINFLNKSKVDKVTLTVIEKNSRALNMYLNRGFKVDYVISYWIVIKE